jgi:hypothetical protein
MPTYTRDTVVEIWPYTRQPEGGDVIIGRVETGTFLAVPPPAVEVLDLLAQGKSIGETSDLYREKYGTLPDMDDFLDALTSNGFVKSNDQEDGSNGATQPPLVKYHFSNFPQEWARRIFSAPVITGACAVVATAIGLMIRDHSLIPRPREVYFTQHRTLNLTLLVLVSYASVVVHEFAHVIAARAKGINSRLGFGNRLWDFVVEADLSGLWSLPKRQRFFPLLAGSLHDAFVGSLVVFLLFANGQKWLALSSFSVRILRPILLIFITRVLWQCLVFVRTDYYYVIATLLNCRNLLSDTETFLRNQIARVIPWMSRVDQSGIPLSERRVIPFFALLWVGGRILALTVFFSITIPVGASYIKNFLRACRVGYSANPSDFVDSVLLCFYLVLPIAVGIPIWIASMARGVRTVVTDFQRT